MRGKFDEVDNINPIYKDIFEAICSFGNGQSFSGTDLHKKVLEKHPGFQHKALSYYVTKTIKLFNLKDKLYKVKKGASVYYIYDDKSISAVCSNDTVALNDTCTTDITSTNEKVVLTKGTPPTHTEEDIELVLDKLMDCVQEAGGRCSDFTKDKLSTMNALDFIMTIHRNMNVEFKGRNK